MTKVSNGFFLRMIPHCVFCKEAKSNFQDFFFARSCNSLVTQPSNMADDKWPPPDMLDSPNNILLLSLPSHT